MRDISYLIFVIVLITFSFYDTVSRVTKEPVKQVKSSLDLKVPKSGQVKSIYNNRYTKLIPLSRTEKDKIYGYTISDRNKHIFAGVKPSTANKMYFVNGYLNGFVPFEPENMWVTLNYLRNRLKYQLDEIGYNKRLEVWQTSLESYIKLRGDCEDHAILLADWLIGLGYDVKVVAGTVKVRGAKPQGHAWVVLFKDGKEYLLEATRKSKWNKIPLASTLPNYFPKYMFNRKDFWINTGSKLTTKYSGSKWKKSGEFFPDNPYYKDLKL